MGRFKSTLDVKCPTKEIAMLDEIKMIEAVAPDIIEVLQERYKILRNIYWMQPIGRRSLSESMGITERVLRTETDLLKNLNLIDTSKSGMTLTTKGEEVYQSLENFMDQLLGTHQTEQQLAEYFGNQRCIVVSGNSEEQTKVADAFGEALSEALDRLLPEGENIIAVMGGTTMAVVAEQLSNLENKKRHNLFVPARGGIGEAITVQANSVSARMAAKANGNHRALYVPEQLSLATYNSLLNEPSIQEVLNLISEANCVIHSIGRALHMAARRKMTEKELVMLKQANAVAESFGYFFNEKGEVVYKVPRIGIELQDLEKVPIIMAIAGGKSKAKAIRAYMKNAPKQTWLITDEAAANEILKGVTL
ncbi:TPA: SorC family transcriptional regulator [Enterococcus faecium]|nr:SorC family transcriptional regulator [Enterococcus faecium]HBL2720314.1 SorC family transcriptional regulator [Enterococcus faecium]